MREVEKQLKDTNKKIDQATSTIKKLQTSVNNIQAKIKEMQGPMTKMLRTVLRKLGIELTVYWAGTFVGPQIDKFRTHDRYELLGQNFRLTYESIKIKLTDAECECGEHFLLKILYVCFFQN